MGEKSYVLGTGMPSWKEGKAQTVTFVVTEDCNLRCKYCYISHKTSNKRMHYETARKFIDLILSDAINHAPAVILEFIGGEPFLEVELIDRICDYFKLEAFKRGSQWFWNYRISITTNGINYGSEEVQRFIAKNKGKISVGITLDGNQEKHDLQRVFVDGRGSYQTIVENIPLYIKQFQPATKVTFASDDLKYLKDAIVNLWNLGITEVAANVVFEDVWKDGDDAVFEKQLKELADYVLDRQLFDRYLCTLFDDSIGGYLDEEQLELTSCGAGKMMAVDADGKIFPCIRYKSYSLNQKQEWTVGDVENGFDMERIRPFMVTATKYQCDRECLECPIGSGCSHCQGYDYDVAESDTNFQRAKYICKMHKARVRANDYYFTQLYLRYGIDRKRNLERHQTYFLLADNYITYCQYENKREEMKSRMSEETIERGMRHCLETFSQPVFVHPKNEIADLTSPLIRQMDSVHIVSADLYRKDIRIPGNVMFVFDESNAGMDMEHQKNCILNLSAEAISKLGSLAEQLLAKADRVNINLLNLEKGFSEEEYKSQLFYLGMVLAKYQGNKEINVITDLEHVKAHHNCGAGVRSLLLSPEGDFYNCVGLYEEKLETKIGDLESGSIHQKNKELYTLEYHPICQNCQAYQCRDCIYLNKKMTNEINVSPSVQCRKSHIEAKVSAEMFGREKKEIYMDPIGTLLEKDTNHMLYYTAKLD